MGEDEPGLGKTRLVQECRKRFMARAGSANGRLPRWLEGRCASYASATPYGLYRQLVAGWAGVAVFWKLSFRGPGLPEESAVSLFAGCPTLRL